MRVEQEPQDLTPQQELETNATKLVFAKIERDESRAAEAVTVITDILFENPSLIEGFAKTQE